MPPIRVGSVSRMLLPTDGLWRGAMYAFQDPSIPTQVPLAFRGHPFLAEAALSTAYLAWVGVWITLILGLAGIAFQRRDL